MRRRILVTGASGFIGRQLVPYLVRAGNHVTLLLREQYAQSDRSPLPDTLRAVRPQIDTVYADLRNFRLTARALRQAQPEIVIHLAAAGVSDPFLGVDTAVRHNLNGTDNLIRATFADKLAAQQLIVARTPGERSSMNVYAASKAAAWSFATMYGRTRAWPIYGAMIFQAYGPEQSPRSLIPSAFTAALQGKDFPMTRGSQARDWIYIDDVVTGIAALCGSTLPVGTTVELGRGETVTVEEVVSLIYKLVGGEGRPLPGALPSRPGETQQQQANLQEAGRHIEWLPTVTLQAGLSQMMADLR